MILDTNFKKIYDNIHGFIKLSNWAMEIINTKEFQRLKYLHQLGTCYYVFPNATHSRFEHSLGTYYLCGRILDSIKKYSCRTDINRWLTEVSELKDYYSKYDLSDPNIDLLDDTVCELVKIAGLCHDLGHGPFSHVFDDVFIKSIRSDKRDTDKHEHRSNIILEKIVSSTQLSKSFTEDMKLFIKSLIDPHNKEGFIYQIVSNPLNGIDVDKCDYIARDTYSVGLKFSFDFRSVIDDIMVINNIISYPKQFYYEISYIFMTRYRLHKQIYTHKSVIASQYMINDIMRLIDPVLSIYKSTFDCNDFIDLTDSYILESVKFLNRTKDRYHPTVQVMIEDAMKIYNRLTEYNFYKFIGTIVTEVEIDVNNEIIKSIDDSINVDNILIHCSKIGLVSGNKKNPLKSIYFYDKKNYKKDKTLHFTIEQERVSAFLPDTYQENLIMFYVKDPTDTEVVEKMKSIYEIILMKVKELESMVNKD